MKRSIVFTAASVFAVMAMSAHAQGLVGGAEQGAAQGGYVAGPVGAVVGGAVGAGVGAVNGALGLPYHHGHRCYWRHHVRHCY